LEFDKYLRTQGELGGFEVVLNEPIRPSRGTPTCVPLPAHTPEHVSTHTPITTHVPTHAPAPTQAPTIVENVKPPQNDSLWQNTTNINDFYNALQQHSIYTKSMRSLSFCIPNEIKMNAAFFLIFHSPLELTAASKNILNRLLKKLNIDLSTCAISFFFKCNEVAMPREKQILKDMLYKEIEFVNPEKIIFFKEANSNINIDGIPITFAGKSAITLYSLLEMQQSNEKIKGTWTALQQSAWFSPDIFQAPK